MTTLASGLPHHPAETTQSILISYSRRDREAVKTLYANLEKCGFKLWRDLHDIEGGEPFWEEIKKGIDGCETVVLCLSSDSLKSEFVQKEWHYARQQGKRVLPVLVADVDFATVPRWMGRVDWKDFRVGTPERDTIWASFIRTLNTPYEGRKVPFMVSNLPPYFVQRPDEFEALLEALVNPEGAVAITAAVKGAGGFGKTTLAMALCHDNRLRGAFDDGILWVTLGEKPTPNELISKALDLVYALTGEKPPVDSKEAAKAELTKAIGDRYILLVIDDLWRKADADIFLVGGSHSATLITTRYDAQLPDLTTFKQNVDAMRVAQAVELLTWGIPSEPSDRPHLETLAKRLGEWAVLLRLVNATLRKRMERGDSLQNALDYTDKALTRKGLKAFGSDHPQERHEAVQSTVGVSLELLSAEHQASFARLAIFPEDADIPFSTLEKLWDLDDFDTEETAQALNDASLLLNFELDQRRIRLHDVMRQYLVEEYRAELKTWQEHFIANLGDLYALPDDYCWRNIAYHLEEAEQLPRLRELLLTPDWLQTKLNQTDVNALLADTKSYLATQYDDTLRLLDSALGMSAHVLSHDKTALAGQLAGRLMSHHAKPETRQFLEQLQTHFREIIYPTSWDIQPAHQQAGGVLLRTLEGHTSDVIGVAVAGEYIISASSDKTLRVWNWQTGETLRTLEGHTSGVNSVALSGDFAISASSDKTLHVWNWQTGEALRTLEGHTSGVKSVALSGDFAVSASCDKTLCVWNWKTGEHLRTLQGHTDDVTSVAIAGEFAISASDDETLRVWNWQAGEALRTLAGHTAMVRSVAVTGEYAISASSDETVRIWNWKAGEHLRTLAGHTAMVRSVTVTGEYAISASSDETVRIWNWKTGEHLQTLVGHTDWVNGVGLASGYAISASSDKTLRVWELPPKEGSARQSGKTLRTLEGHTNIIFNVALSGEFAVSASDDRTLRVWNWKTGEHLRTLEGHTSGVKSVALSGDFAISASDDMSLRVWNWKTGQHLRTLQGHTDDVTSVAIADEYIISASDDRTLRVWNWKTGQHLWTLQGHISVVKSVAIAGEYIISASYQELWVWGLPLRGGFAQWAVEHLRALGKHTGWVINIVVAGNFAISTSDDTSLHVWNWQAGEALRTLEGHTSVVQSVAMSGDFAVSASRDQTLRVWNWKTGAQLGIFYGDVPLTAVAVQAEEDGLLIVAGDRAGRVLFLRWHAG